MLADKQRGKGTFDAYSLPSSSFCLTHATRLYSRPLPRMSPSRFSSYLPMCCHADPPRAFISYAAPLSLLYPRKSRQSKALAALLFFSLPLRQLTPPSFSSPHSFLTPGVAFFCRYINSYLILASTALAAKSQPETSAEVRRCLPNSPAVADRRRFATHSSTSLPVRSAKTALEDLVPFAEHCRRKIGCCDS